MAEIKKANEEENDISGQKGLIIVHTGNGKGKTTAALGLAMRAWGDGLKVLILQFIKGGWQYGEMKTIETLAGIDSRIELRRCGRGFTRRNDADREEHIKCAEAALNEAEKEMLSGSWDLIILDEINYAVKFELISVQKVFELLNKKPAKLHLVLTGREAKSELIEQADLVTEMKQIKHPFEQGVKAQKGIEF